MATYYLINNVRVAGRVLIAGLFLNDAADDTTAITAAGGRLYPSADAGVAAAAAIANAMRLRGAPPEEAESVMLAAADLSDKQAGDVATVANTTATNVATTTTHSNHVRFTNPPAADLVSIVAALDPVADGALVIAAQPVVPCKLQVRIVDANGSISAGTCTLVGVGASGEAVGQVINLAGGTRTIVTDEAYAQLTSGTVAGVAGAAAGDTIGIGQSSALGLPGCANPASSNFVVYKATVDDADETVGTVDATNGTIIPTTAPNGTHDYDVWYTYDVAHNHTQAAHTHTATLS